MEQIAEHYAYLDTRAVDLGRLPGLYRQRAAEAATGPQWTAVLEEVISELYDHHATLGRNTERSPRLVPSGTDLWANIVDGRAVITAVRPGSVAAAAGLRPGLHVTEIGGVAAADAIAAKAPRSLLRKDPEAADWALRVLLAGTHLPPRRFVVCDEASVCRPIELGVADNPAGSDPISWRRIDPTIGYIRVEDSLGDSNTVAAFDAALAGLRDVRGLVLDLRMTPSGGDTEVAEPMLGRFIAKTSGYQRVFEPRPGRRFPDDSWVKTLSPRGPWVVEQDLVVLVDRWTGSMGEGMAIGLDALGRAEVVGTRMAGLLGGVGTFKLPRTGVVVRFPIERLYHVNGTPREAFVPRIVVDAGAVGGDPVLEAGLAALRARLARAPQVGVPGSQ